MIDRALAVPTFHEACVDVFVPNPAGLASAVYVLQQLKDMGAMLSVMMKTLWDFHVHVTLGVSLGVCEDKINLSAVMTV
jgi:hypothetical protein